MGPVSRYLGPWVPEPQLWQDPVPPVDHELIDDADVTALKSKILASGLSVSQLVTTAWASAASFRGTDKRGGANGARIRLAPQRDWEVNDRPSYRRCCGRSSEIQQEFNAAQSGGKKVSLADLIVLGGLRGGGAGRRSSGARRRGPLRAGTHRRVAGADRRGVVRRARAEGRRVPQLPAVRARSCRRSTLLLDRANLLTLTAPEMTVLVGGMRALGANYGAVSARRLHRPAGDVDQRLLRQPARHGHRVEGVDSDENVYEGRDRASGDVRWTATAVDLVFGSNSQLRAIAEVYGARDGEEKFVRDFVAAWDKVMTLDRFDLR